MPHPHSNMFETYDNQLVSLNSLAAVTGVISDSQKIDSSRSQGFRTLLQEGVLKHQAGDGAGGPLLVGFTDGGLSLSEIEEKIEADPQSQSDRPTLEQARRRIFILAYVDTDSGGAGTNVGAIQRFRTKHQWSFIEGVGCRYFVYNTNSATAMDAANSLEMFVKHAGVWLRD